MRKELEKSGKVEKEILGTTSNKTNDILKARVKELEKALEFYADKKTYKLGVRLTMGSAFALHEPIKYDEGEKAREALKGE